MSGLGAWFVRGLRRWVQGLPNIAVGHGWLPPQALDPDPDPGPALDEPPAGHPERLVPHDPDWHRDWVR